MYTLNFIRDKVHSSFKTNGAKRDLRSVKFGMFRRVPTGDWLSLMFTDNHRELVASVDQPQKPHANEDASFPMVIGKH